MNEITRREFVRVAGIAAGGFAVLGNIACGNSSQPTTKTKTLTLPSLGGAPDTEDGRTIAAFCDTVIPGAYRDPKGRPGLVDTSAVGLFFDPELPALQFVPALAILLNSQSETLFAASFVDIAPEEREEVLAETLKQIEIVNFAVELAKLAFYSSEEAATYLGYPGPNNGYVNDKDFSFGMAMSKEITQDGNLG